MIKHFFILLFLIGTGFCAEKNIIFFITDDQSPTLGCYGDKVAITPHIDSLAKDGTVFLNAYATTASCSASRSVVMSGLHNHKNGQYGHTHHFHKFASYPDVVALSLPRVLANEGYRTMLCIEAANTGAQRVRLAPGERHEITQTIELL